MVTGTLLSGTIRKEDELEVFPAGSRVRVRGIQVHGQPAEQALAGQRTALESGRSDQQELARGMITGAPHVSPTISRWMCRSPCCLGQALERPGAGAFARLHV